MNTPIDQEAIDQEAVGIATNAAARLLALGLFPDRIVSLMEDAINCVLEVTDDEDDAA